MLAWLEQIVRRKAPEMTSDFCPGPSEVERRSDEARRIAEERIRRARAMSRYQARMNRVARARVAASPVPVVIDGATPR